MTPRAMPLPPDERRADILRAARPLLLEHGGRFTTRQVAEAAGIAEGTLFRVFATKRDLMHAVIAQAMDPSATCEQLDAIDRDLPLPVRVTRTMALLQQAIHDVSAIFGALFSMPTEDAKGLAEPDHHRDPDALARRQEQSQSLHEAVRRVLEPDAALLACTLDEAASLLRSLAFATAHPHFSDHRTTGPARISQLVLDGLLARSPSAAGAADTSVAPVTTHTPSVTSAPGTQEKPC